MLPVKNELTLAKNLSIIIALLMSLLSLVGIIFPVSSYHSQGLIETYFTNDVINLVIGLPILLGSLWLTSRGKLAGLLIWPGALLFVIYNYLVYLIGIPLSYFSIAYLFLVLVSAYIVHDVLRSLDQELIKEQLSGKVFEKLTGWFLVIFGILFILRAANIFLGAFIHRTGLPTTEIGTLIADISISILWIIGGILLLRGNPLGYVSGLGLLFSASMLFLGLILFLIIQPLITPAVLSMIDIVVVVVMAVIFSIPFGLYLRGVIQSGKKPELS